MTTNKGGARFIQFDAPKQVSVRDGEVGECEIGEVQVSTIVSAVSTGTELLVYNGHMTSDIAADAVFESQQQRFSYPCRYGYAAVGTVVRSRDDTVATASRVFAFREHSSAFCEKANNVHVVPSDVDALDACLFANVETAVSLAFDAALLPGESITIVGQGMVGLLLTAVIRRLYPYSSVVTVDTVEQRRKLSVQQGGAHYSFSVDEARGERMKQVFGSGTDVSVEVSGCGDGLQTAICCTRDHGRVVIGSWYGTKRVVVDGLGGRFHRSHIELVASQVSEIAPRVGGRWTKARRFELVWRLLRDIEPAKRFPVWVVGIDEAAAAYEKTANGEVLQVMVRYNDDS